MTAPWYRIRQQGEPDETLIPLAVAVALVAALPLVVRAARAVHTLRPWQPHSGGGYLARTPAPVPIPAASWSAFTQQLLLDRARFDSENARHRPGPGSVLRLPTPEPAPAGIEADRFQVETHTPPPAPEPEPQPEPEPAHNETYVEGTAWQDENSGEVLLTTSCNCPLSQHQRMVGQDWPTDPPDTQYADPPPSPPPTITDQLAAAETDLNLSPTETETDPPPSPPPTITDRLAAAVLEIAPDPDQPATPAAVWQGAAAASGAPVDAAGEAVGEAVGIPKVRLLPLCGDQWGGMQPPRVGLLALIAYRGEATVSEVHRVLGTSKSSAKSLLWRARKAGWVTWDGHQYWRLAEGVVTDIAALNAAVLRGEEQVAATLAEAMGRPLHRVQGPTAAWIDDPIYAIKRSSVRGDLVEEAANALAAAVEKWPHRGAFRTAVDRIYGGAG